MGHSNKIAGICDKISEWSLYILIFALPFAKSIVEITIVTALVGLIIKKIVMRERFFSGSGYTELFLGFFLAASLLSLFNTSYLNPSIRALFSKSLKFAALFLMVREILNTKDKIRKFVFVAVSSCVLILADGFIQYFITHRDLLHGYFSFKYISEPDSYFIGFPTASFPFPNDFAAWILMFIFPAGTYFFLGKGSRSNSFISGAMLFGLFYSLILTKTRGAWLGFLIALMPLFFFVKFKKIIFLFLIIALFCGIFINRALIPDIFGLVSVNDRATMWHNGWEIFEKHPIIGNGLNTFYLEYMKIRNDKYRDLHGSYAHNCYLQMAADIGIIGLAAFLSFVAALIAKGFCSLSKVKSPFYYSLILGTNLGLIAFLIHSAVDTNLYSLNLAALFWVTAGFMTAIIKIAEKSG